MHLQAVPAEGQSAQRLQGGSGGAAEDSIEHYSRCRVLRRLRREERGLEDGWLLPHWIAAHSSSMSPVQHFQYALGAYASYRVTNLDRHQ